MLNDPDYDELRKRMTQHFGSREAMPGSYHCSTRAEENRYVRRFIAS